MSFVTLIEKTHSTPLRTSLLSWCPTMDLVVMVSDSAEVVLYRLNGQRVWVVILNFGGNSHSTPQSLAWRPDGKVIALGFDNGDLAYLDVNDGKVINHSYTGKGHPDTSASSLLNWLEGSLSTQKAHKPRVKHDVRTQLPFLPPLPVSSTERIYTNTHAIHSLIHDLEKQTDVIRMLAVGSPHSTFGLWIGSFHLDLSPSELSKTKPSLVDHAASVGLNLHALVVQNEGKHMVLLYDLDLFTSNYEVSTAMINTFNDFQSVSAYLAESLQYLTEEYNLMNEVKKPAFDELQRTLGKEQSSSDLFAFLMTGVPQAKLKTWLDEHVSERVVKRWEKSSQSSFNNISRVLDESCMQASNRLIIMIMILREMSVNPSHAAITNLKTSEIDVVLKSVELLIAQLHEMRLIVVAESQLFSAFCQWLVHAIARMPDDDEHPDTPMPVATRQVVDFLETHLWTSDFDGFFQQTQEADLQKFLRLDLSYDTYDSFPRLVGQDTPTLAQTYAFLQKSSKQIFFMPAKLLASKWHVLDALTISSASKVTARSRFIVEDDTSILYIAWVEHHESEEQDSIFILRKDPRSPGRSAEACKLSLKVADSPAFSVQDIQFVDDQELLVLVQNTTAQPRESHLMAFDYRASQYRLYDVNDGGVLSAATVESVVCVPSKHKTLETGVHPIALAVNGRKGRRTGLYIQSDRQRYTIFDLDDQEDDIEEVDEDEDDADVEDEIIMDED